MNQKILIVCSVIPPAKDAVGESAIKIIELLNFKNIKCSVVTSSNQIKNDYSYTIIKKWGMRGIVDIISLAIKNQYVWIIFKYPTPFYYRNLFISFLPFFCRVMRINTMTYLHEYASYSLLGKIRILPIILFSNKVLVTDRINYELVKKKTFDKSKVRILSIGSNLKDEEFIRSFNDNTQSTRKKDKISVLYFGYIMEGKGLENYFEIAQRLAGENFKFFVIGSLPENPNSKAEEIFNRLKNSSFINCLGFVEKSELSKHFQEMDVVYLPFKEGVTERRTSFMTAMGFGKIVITSKPHIAINGLVSEENVFFMDDFSAKAFERLLNTIKKLDYQKIQTISKKAHNWYMENYSDKIFIDKFISNLNKV